MLCTEKVKGEMIKTRLNLAVDKDLVGFMQCYAKENRITVTDLITQYILALKRTIEGKENHQVIYDPSFNRMMEEIQATARSGKAQWHSFKEVFGESPKTRKGARK